MSDDQESVPVPEPPPFEPTVSAESDGEKIDRMLASESVVPRRGRGRPRKDGKPTAQHIPPELYKTSKPEATAPDARDARYFANILGELHNRHVSAIRRGVGGVKNYKETLQGIIAEASLRGIKPESVMDNRDLVDRVADVIDRLEDLEDVMRLNDDEVAAVEKAMDLADRLCQTVTVEEVRKTEKEYGKTEKMKALKEKYDALKKAWGDRIAKVRRLKDRARTPVPPGILVQVPLYAEAARASQYLRHMVYVMRSNLSDRQAAGGARGLIDIQYHHAKLAFEYWMSRNNLTIHPLYGEIRDRMDKTCWSSNLRAEGFITVMPPGSGKTTFALGAISFEINHNPNLKLLIGHAQEEQAKTNLVYLAKFYDPADATGQRNRALWEGVPEIKHVSRTQFRLKTKETSRQPTARAHGMTAKISGSDADFIWFDDPVDQSEREQPEERRRKSELMVGNWMSRLRGPHTFHLTTTTLWHEDDANMRRLKLAKQGKLLIDKLLLSCGGPETHPKFHSIWPEVLPPSKLKQIWTQDPAMYAAAYMADPRPEEHQIIRRLRLYNPDTPAHREFVKNATCYLSVDPAATARQKSNKSGIIYAGLGSVTDGTVTERRLRIFDARQLLATQSQVIEHVAAFSFANRVDYCVIEIVSAFQGLKEQLENQFGIAPIAVHPGLKSKEIRLRGVAPMIEDHRASSEQSGAVVEFPGVLDGTTGAVVPDPRFERLYEQFLRFGVTANDDMLDAVVQLAAHLQRSGELSPGSGFVTEAVQRTVATGDNRIKRMLDEFAGRKPAVSVDQEDAEFAYEMGGATWN